MSTIERLLSGLAWNYAQRGFALERKNRHIASVFAGIKCKHGQPPMQKEAIRLRLARMVWMRRQASGGNI